VVSCLAEMAMHEDDERMNDSWSVCCVLHKKANTLTQALFWTPERTKKALELVQPMILDEEEVIK